MDRQGHFFVYTIAIMVIHFIFYNINAAMLFALIIFGILMNPDYLEIDQDSHRWFVSHSILFPTIIYWALHPFINLAMANLLSIVLILPIVAHLIADLGGVQGFGLINLYPFHKKLSVIKSYLWIIANIIIGIVLMVILN
jgi:hypothetical protein